MTTNRISHTNCLHSADSKGRAACRRAGGPLGYANKVRADMIASGEALCSSCFWNATDSAMMNLEDSMKEEGKDITLRLTDSLADAQFMARAYTWAREYLFDRSAISVCSEHDHLI